MRFIAALFLLVLVGCAQEKPVPLCEAYQFMAGIDQNGDDVAVLDLKNVKKLQAMVDGLAAGTCRLEKNKGAKNADA